jgi:hypothetical protein
MPVFAKHEPPPVRQRDIVMTCPEDARRSKPDVQWTCDTCFETFEWRPDLVHQCAGPAWISPGDWALRKRLVEEARKKLSPLPTTGADSGPCIWDCGERTRYGIQHDCSGPPAPRLGHLEADAAINRARVAAVLAELGIDPAKLAKENP